MDKYYEEAEAVIAQVKRVVIGKDACIQKAMAAILAGGHILIEDIPGVGKTTLARAFSNAMDLESRRIQFTPDVMPSDLVGFSMYQKKEDQFIYQPGAVMCNLFLGDEINRTSPKTQSALLEVMEEGSATVDGVTRKVPRPFVVMATQNPVGSVGTQKLPESQLDRFMIRMEMGYPDFQSQVNILRDRQTENPLDKAEQVTSTDEILKMQDEVTQIYIEDKILEYVTSLAMNTREQEMIRLGVSPRGALAVTRLAKARAYVQGRDYVTPEDVQKVFLDVCAHRIILNPKAKIAALSASDVLIEVLKQTKSPDNGR